LKICKTCVLPETFPGIKFDQDGVCNLCRQSKAEKPQMHSKAPYQEKFESLLAKYQGLKSYDGILAYSGGKDSTYTLFLLREKYNLKILALTFDNGFIPEVTLQNIRRVTDQLGVDLMLFKPHFELLRKVFQAGTDKDIYAKKTLERASTICTSCMGLVKFYCLRTALEKDIPFLIYGWSPGQIPMSSSIFKNNKSMLKSMQQAIFDPLYKIAGEEIVPYFLEKRHFEQENEFPYNISPLAFLEYDEEVIFKKVKALGWVKPEKTDPNSTNCLLNAFAVVVHKKRLGFHPYALELANLVRGGFLDRQEALDRLYCPDDAAMVDLVKKKLGLDND
jgi:tRNA(Ile)-lysidine synthase TilS/MesJ